MTYQLQDLRTRNSEIVIKADSYETIIDYLIEKNLVNKDSLIFIHSEIRSIQDYFGKDVWEDKLKSLSILAFNHMFGYIYYMSLENP